MSSNNCQTSPTENDPNFGFVLNKAYSKQPGLSVSHIRTHRNIHLVLNNHYWYGILTCFNYNYVKEDLLKEALDFYAERLLGELFVQTNDIKDIDQLNDQKKDEFYKSLIKQVFKNIEIHRTKDQSEKLSLKVFLEETLSDYFKNFQEKSNELSIELSIGLSCVIMLLHESRAYIANIGDTRAMLCKKVLGESGQEHFTNVELSIRHDLSNQNEIERLKEINVDTASIIENKKVGNMSMTRCLGNLWLKQFYKDYPQLTNATKDPILSEPNINIFEIDDRCSFVILASASLFETLQQIVADVEVSDFLTEMVYKELQTDSNVDMLSQLIIDKIGELHHKRFIENIQSPSLTKHVCRFIDDITLFIKKLEFDSVNKQNKNLESLHSTNEVFSELNINVKETEESSDLIQTSPNKDQVVPTETEPYVDFTPLLIALNELPLDKE